MQAQELEFRASMKCVRFPEHNFVIPFSLFSCCPVEKTCATESVLRSETLEYFSADGITILFSIHGKDCADHKSCYVLHMLSCEEDKIVKAFLLYPWFPFIPLLEQLELDSGSDNGRVSILKNHQLATSLLPWSNQDGI